MERASFSDAGGYPTLLDRLPSAVDHTGWEVVTSPATDREGWQYGSVFSKCGVARPGGRASQRVMDMVRRRRWQRHGPAGGGLSPTATAVAGSAPLLSLTTADVAQTYHPGGDAGHVGLESGREQSPGGDRQRDRKAAVSGGEPQRAGIPLSKLEQHRRHQKAEADKRKAVLRLFVGMFTASIKRWQLWNLVPLDPMSLLVLYNEHHVALADLISSNMPHRLPPHSLQGDPSPGGGKEPTQLVHDLLRAAVHSRAAYGYAMQAGHVSSVLKFALMHTVHSFSFDAAGGASAEANCEAVSVLSGVAPADILQAEWLNGVGRPCHYVAVDRANRSIVLSVRGSLEVGDVFSDISANALEVSLLGCQGQVHEGIMAAATYVHSNTAAALQRAAADFPGWPLLLTGHSLGGAVASLVAVLLQDVGAPTGMGPISCIGIGPASAMNLALAKRCDPFVTSVCIRSDFVPRLTYASVEGMFLELADSSPMRRAAAGVSRTVAATLEGLGMWGAKRAPPPVNTLAGLAEFPKLAESSSEATEKAARTARNAVACSSARNPPPSPCAAQVAAAGSIPAVEVAADYVSRQDKLGGWTPTGEWGRHSGSKIPKPGCVRLQHSSGGVINPQQSSEGVADADGNREPAAGEGTKTTLTMPRPEHAPQELSGVAEGGIGRAQHATSEERAVLEDVFAGLRDGASAGDKPEALYPAGRVLWLIPAEDEATGESDSKEASSDEDEDLGLFESGGKLPVARAHHLTRSRSAMTSKPSHSAAGQVSISMAAASGGHGAQTAPGPLSSWASRKKAALASHSARSDFALTPVPQPTAPLGGEQLGYMQYVGTAAGACKPARLFRPVLTPVHAVLQQQGTEAQKPPGDSPPGLDPGRIIGFGGSGTGGFGTETGEVGNGSQSSAAAAAAGGGGDDAKDEQKPPALLDVDRRIFGRILLSPDSLSDHLPDTYLSYLRLLASEKM